MTSQFTITRVTVVLGPVVETVDTVIHRINHYLRLVFTSDGVGVGIVSEVSRATESESEESESFHFLPIPPKTPSLMIK